MGTITVLLIDDEKSFAELVRMNLELSGNYRVIVALSGKEGIKIAKDIKPDVILFGEQLPQTAWFKAQREARQCDLMLVAGSSLEVLPVAGLPMQALDRGAHLIIINNTQTYLNVRADVVILEDVAMIIPAIAERVLHG